jgi:ornithine decarboxylase
MVTNLKIFRLLLRLGFNVKSSCKVSFGAKFGCSYETGKELLRKAKELNLNVCGVAFHIGLCFQEFKIFLEAIKDSADMFAYGRSLGLKMSENLVFSFNISLIL